MNISYALFYRQINKNMQKLLFPTLNNNNKYISPKSASYKRASVSEYTTCRVNRRQNNFLDTTYLLNFFNHQNMQLGNAIQKANQIGPNNFQKPQPAV